MNNFYLVRVKFFSNSIRKNLSYFNTDVRTRYSPHLIIKGDNEYLGVTFVEGTVCECDKENDAVVESIYKGVGYYKLVKGAELKNLVMLSVENFQKINDYSALVALDNLEMLTISGDVWSPKYIHIDSLDFLCEMKQLRSFSLEVARVKSKDYTPILELENIEYLTIESCKEVKAIYDQVMKLPKLKYGLLIEHPEFYQ